MSVSDHHIRITPSILSADRENIVSEIAKIAAVSDLIHLDIMDNRFVPNQTWDLAEAQAIITASPTPIDAHLMVEDVDTLAIEYAIAGSGSVTIHAEAAIDISKTLRGVRSHGARAGLAVKPGTPIEDYLELSDLVDMFLIMTVEPGFGGQKFMSEMMEKVRLTRKWIGDRPIWLQVDGGISIDTITIARDAGADTFVAGSAVFNSPEPAVMVEMLRHRASAL
jgi:ribulose-phosphate 3-epimerase